MNDTTIGFVCTLVSCLAFGSNFVAAKNVDLGDGIYFQFIMCVAIFVVSIPAYIAIGCPPFEPFAMLGGFLWCTGNLLCLPVIRLIGIGLGVLTWGTVGMLLGWASGSFGLFGLNKQEVASPLLNYSGIGIAMIGLLLYLQVQTTTSSSSSSSTSSSSSSSSSKVVSPMAKSLLLNEHDDESGGKLASTSFDEVVAVPTSSSSTQEASSDFASDWSPTKRRIVGLLGAIISGCFFGLSFDPAQYLIDRHYHNASINYVFPHYMGIFLTSWLYLVAYCILCSGHLRLCKTTFFAPSNLILPATISGLLWGIAELCWFIANGSLGFSVTFPIMASGPGFVSAIWGVFVFGEIKGTRDLTILALAFLITLCALVLVGLSH